MKLTKSGKLFGGLILAYAVCYLAVVVAVIWVGIHFIHKFW